MRVLFKRYPIFFSLNLKRLEKVVGICSRDKLNPQLHYLLFDCDGDIAIEYFTANYPKHKITSYPTPHGHHIIVWKPCTFPEAIRELSACPFTDLIWVAIGIRRGYWFLQQHHPIEIPKGTHPTYMRIER